MPAKKSKGGRPKKDINWEQLKAMVRIQCTQEECCAVLGVTEPTLTTQLKEQGYAGFLEFYKKYSHEGLASLRRAQWKAAVEQNNPTMLVWMGKQMLGQQDKASMEHSGKLAFEGIERVIIDPKTKASDS
jgi:hypothetical protein